MRQPTIGLICALLLLCFVTSRHGEGFPAPRKEGRTYWIAPGVKPGGNGSRERPFHSLGTALDQAGGGNTFIFRPGLYRGPLTVGKQYAGTEKVPTVLKSLVKWKAVIFSSEHHGISNGDNCDWLVVDGFEVSGARMDGIKLSGDHNTVRNCHVHNNAFQGIAMHAKKSGILENNLVEFNGCHIQFHHGIYASGDALILRNNIIRHNSGYGLHMHGGLRKSVIANNVICGHGKGYSGGILLDCPRGGGQNRIINNTIVKNGTGIRIINGKGEVIVNNIFWNNDRALLFRDTANVHADYNLIEPRAKDIRKSKHDVEGDPHFLHADRDMYWLRKGSSCIGKGNGSKAPSKDFWGRPNKRKQTDLGAFAYDPELEKEHARKGWHNDWSYRFAYDLQYDLPDLWKEPGK